MAADSLALLKALTSSVLAAKNTIYEIKNVGEIARGLEEEVEAFAFFLPILEFEIHKSVQLALSHDWWDEAKIVALVGNATKTSERLKAILSEIRRQRTALQNVREFYRSTQYDTKARLDGLAKNAEITGEDLPSRSVSTYHSPRLIAQLTLIHPRRNTTEFWETSESSKASLREILAFVHFSPRLVLWASHL